MKFICSILLSAFSFVALNAQHWKSIERSDIPQASEDLKIIKPFEFESYELDLESLVKDLTRVPSEEEALAKNDGLKMEFPLPNGEIMEFIVWEASVMEEGLMAKFPNIRSYKGIVKGNSSFNIRFDIGTFGFHAAIASPYGQIYIDPIYTDNTGLYQVYFTKNQHIPEALATSCGLDLSTLEQDQNEAQIYHHEHREGTVPLYEYRLAVATTGEFGQIAGSLAETMSRIVTGTTRLNQMFENEIGVRFILVNNNDELIHLNPDTDPYTIVPNIEDGAHPGRQVLAQNTNVINSIIGAGAYDVGHVFTTWCTDGIAGVAAFGSACTDFKANGVSCVGNSNIASFMVNTTAHEIGHQFAASHTWNACPNSEDQLAIGTAFEPGSGSTIMSYAGVCGPNNVVGTNDDYFHAGSLDQMLFFISDPFDCAEKIETGNHPPMAFLDYEDGFFIPVLTPFELEGSATDMDGDNLTYNWEQMNNSGALQPLGTALGDAPSFRSVYPSASPVRTFPRISALVGNFDEDSELLPDANRSLDFRFVVRDNNPSNGLVAWQDLTFRASVSAGPFFVQFPNIDPPSFEVGEEVEIEWKVANTDNDIINCQFVDILLSDNGGQTYDHVLIKNTPNDGAQSVRIANAITSFGRIKVAASDNIFFDISNDNFDILEPSEPTYVYTVSESTFNLCLPASVNFDVESTAFQGYSDEVSFAITEGLPDGAIATISNETISPDGNSNIDINLDNVTESGIYNVVLQAISGTDTTETIITMDLTATGFDDFATVSPNFGESGVNQLPTFSWVNAVNADQFNFELSTSPAFGESSLISQSGITDTFFTPGDILDKSTLYYWRVTPSNKCATSTIANLQTFGTVALSCNSRIADDLPKNISQSGLPTIESVIPVIEEGTISVVSIQKIKGLHDNTGDLKGILVSPAGTEVVLFDRICGNSTNFNCGFDDDSPTDAGCSLNTGTTYKPEESLSLFAGESINGDWVLRIEDSAPGNGGQLQEIDLQICSNQTLNPPILVRNDVLEVPTNFASRLRNDILLVEDENNGATELIYTLVTLPQFGTLSFNGEQMNIGDQFTQQDVNNEAIRYVHDGTATESDAFDFTVIDGEGGFINITTFNIYIGEDAISSTEDQLSEVLFSIAPNPVKDQTIVSISVTDNLNYDVNVLDVTGKKLQSLGTYYGSNEIQLNTTDFSAGTYVVQLKSTKGIKSIKLNVIK